MELVKASNGIEYYKLDSGTYFTKDTPVELAEKLDSLRLKDIRIRLWYGKDGKSWNEENDVTGYIGRTTGTIPVLILLNNAKSTGGGAILTDCIIKLVNTKYRDVIWQHPNFSQDHFSVTDGSDLPEYSNNVTANGKIQARFKSKSKAQRYADFMNGLRFSK